MISQNMECNSMSHSIILMTDTDTQLSDGYLADTSDDDVNTNSDIDTSLEEVHNKCYICLQSDDTVIKLCPCNFVHYECLYIFINLNNKSKNVCHICHAQYYDSIRLPVQGHEVIQTPRSLKWYLLYNMLTGILSVALIYITFGSNITDGFGNHSGIDGSVYYMCIFGAIFTIMNYMYQGHLVYKYRKICYPDILALKLITVNLIWTTFNQGIGYGYLCNNVDLTTVHVNYFTIYNSLIGMTITFAPIMALIVMIQLQVKFEQPQ